MQFDRRIEDILALSGRENSWKFTLLDKDENVKVRELTNVESFTMTYSSLSSLKCEVTAKMHDDTQINFLSDRLLITLIVRIRKMKFEFPMGIYLFNSPSCDRDGRTQSLVTDTRNVALYSKLKIYQDDKIMSDYELAAGTNILSKILSLLGTSKCKFPTSTRVLQTNKSYQIGTSKLEIINDLLDTLGWNSLSVDGEGYFYSSKYVEPPNRSIDFTYTDESNQQIMPNFTDEFDLSGIYNVFTGYCTINNVCYNYSFINSNESSPTSTINLGRNICADAREFSECTSYQDLQRKVRSWAAENTTKYHKCTFTTFINPLHGYLNCILFKNAKVNMKGIETQWVIDSRDNTMKHTIREAVAI